MLFCVCVCSSSDEFTPVEGDEKNNTSESSSEGIVCSCWTYIKTNHRNAAISRTSTIIMFFIYRREEEEKEEEIQEKKKQEALRGQ